MVREWSEFNRSVAGGFAGLIIGPLIYVVVFLPEPPADVALVGLCCAAGAVIGASLAALAGNRSVPIVILYFVVAFGLISLIPWSPNKSGHCSRSRRLT